MATQHVAATPLPSREAIDTALYLLDGSGPARSSGITQLVALLKDASFRADPVLEERLSSLLQVLIAAKAHQDVHGTLPESLEAMVPDFLPRVPRDAHAGGPLGYSREARAVWSAGEDFVPASAHPEPDPRNAAEPAISLAF